MTNWGKSAEITNFYENSEKFQKLYNQIKKFETFKSDQIITPTNYILFLEKY